jgi:hypothetical protein
MAAASLALGFLSAAGGGPVHESDVVRAVENRQGRTLLARRSEYLGHACVTLLIEAGPELPPSGVAAGAPQGAAGLSRGHRAKPQDHHAVTLTRPRSLLSAARVA